MGPIVQVGCGADELIDLLMRCVLDPGDVIVDCPPTFTMYAFDADVNNARVVTVPRLEGFRLDVPGAVKDSGLPARVKLGRPDELDMDQTNKVTCPEDHVTIYYTRVQAWPSRLGSCRVGCASPCA